MATVVASDAIRMLATNNQADDHSTSNGTMARHVPVSAAKSVPFPERAKHLARRSKSNGHAGMPPTSESLPAELNTKKFMKNSRRSRSRFGRGLAKKGTYQAPKLGLNDKDHCSKTKSQ